MGRFFLEYGYPFPSDLTPVNQGENWIKCKFQVRLNNNPVSSAKKEKD